MTTTLTQFAVILHVDNYYEDGEHIQTVVETKIDEPPYPIDGAHDNTTADYEDWEDANVFQHTGADYPEGGDAGYFVEVMSSERPDLLPVGTKFEFC